jgi:hypothetical protein
MRKSFFVTGMGIEVYHKDIETAVDWGTAKRRAERFDYDGGGWRLPTMRELEVMNSLFNLGVCKLDSRDYWSSDVLGDGRVGSFEINYGPSAWPWKSETNLKHAVRPVRDIISK